MALAAEDDVRRTESLDELRRDAMKRFDHKPNVGLQIFQRPANLARARALAVDCVVDY